MPVLIEFSVLPGVRAEAEFQRASYRGLEGRWTDVMPGEWLDTWVGGVFELLGQDDMARARGGRDDRDG